MEQINTQSVMPTAVRPSVMMVEGKGSWLTDNSGARYLDFVQGWAVNCLGHSPDIIVDAITTQARRLINPSPAFFNDQMVNLTALISKTSGLDHVFLCNSGAEANEGAIKLARKWGQLHKKGAYQIITFHNGFHGRTLATMSASGKPQWETLFEPKVPGFIKVPYNDIEMVRNAITDQTVAIMLEMVQGEGGVVPAETEFVQELRRLADEKDLLIIVDEVQTGVGRAGSLYCFQQYGIRPDIMTLGKGLGGGVPIAALVAASHVSVFEPGDQGGTYNGNPLMAAVGVTVLATVSDPVFLAQVAETADYLTTQLQALSDRLGLNGIRGKGLLQALILSDETGADIVARAFENGLLINSPRPNLIRFMPSLTVSKSEIDQMIGILEGVV